MVATHTAEAKVPAVPDFKFPHLARSIMLQQAPNTKEVRLQTACKAELDIVVEEAAADILEEEEEEIVPALRSEEQEALATLVAASPQPLP